MSEGDAMENGISKRLLLLYFGITVLVLSGAGLSHAFGPESKSSLPEVVPGEIIVKLKASHSGQKTGVTRQLVQKSLGMASLKTITPFRTDPRLQLVKMEDVSRLGLETAVRRLNASPEIEFAEPNYVVRASQIRSGTPNDERFNELWGISNLGQADPKKQVGSSGSDINVMPLWEKGITGNRKVVVAVIDTGIDWDHPDLIENLYTNPGEAGALATNGIDDDGNGFVDDVHGYNFNNGTPKSDDDGGHGTHCAGTIGGVANNGIGIAGVAWNVRLMPVKFLGADGSGTTAGSIESVNYARLMGVDVMSNSWGGGGFSRALLEAVAATQKAGIVFVAAAGNDHMNNDTTDNYPSNYALSNIIAVAATDNKDQIASFSNYGASKVHVAAPGVAILSTVPDGKYDAYSGTSMATPHVSGVVALMLSQDSKLKPEEVKSRLITTSDRVAGLRKKTQSKGRVDAYQAVMNIVPPNDDIDESLWKSVDYALESEHPYAGRTNLSFTISHPGAKYIRVIFEKVATEACCDKIKLADAVGTIVDEVSGKRTGVVSEPVKGDTVILTFRSDPTMNDWGFKISTIQVIE